MRIRDGFSCKDLNHEYPAPKEPGAIKFISYFSQLKEPMNYEKVINEINNSFPICIKGVEINLKDGDVNEFSIREGLSQIRYALPYVFREQIIGNLSIFENIETAKPFIVIPILLTTAKLHILKDEITIDKIKQVKSIDEISKEVPYLISYSDSSINLEEHCSYVFDNTAEFIDKRKLNSFDKVQGEKKRIGKTIPVSTLLSLFEDGIATEYFNHIFICNFDSFSKLLDELKNNISNYSDSLEFKELK